MECAASSVQPWSSRGLNAEEAENWLVLYYGLPTATNSEADFLG